jgi:uncharacterized protein YecE (DUF72 family)
MAQRRAKTKSLPGASAAQPPTPKPKPKAKAEARPDQQTQPATVPIEAPANADALDAAALALAAREPSIRIGTSGFSYAEWRGVFYPEKLAAKGFLHWYAQRFPTTEVNNTFYRIPRRQMTAQWRAEVADDFRFTLKLSQRVTHIKRLKDVDAEMSWFLAAALELGPTLGPVLMQLPPNFRKDAARLEEFLAKHAPRLQLAIEFRHASWLDDEIEQLLRQHRVAIAVVETEPEDRTPQTRLVTGPFAYLRLRKRDYAPGALRDWAAWIHAQDVPAYVYVKHDIAAPVVARALVAAFGDLSA